MQIIVEETIRRDGRFLYQILSAMFDGLDGPPEARIAALREALG